MEMEALDKTEPESLQQFDSADSRRNSNSHQSHANSKPESEIQQELELADPLMSNDQYVEPNVNIHEEESSENCKYLIEIFRLSHILFSLQVEIVLLGLTEFESLCSHT